MIALCHVDLSQHCQPVNWPMNWRSHYYRQLETWLNAMFVLPGSRQQLNNPMGWCLLESSPSFCRVQFFSSFASFFGWMWCFAAPLTEAAIVVCTLQLALWCCSMCWFSVRANTINIAHRHKLHNTVIIYAVTRSIRCSWITLTMVVQTWSWTSIEISVTACIVECMTHWLITFDWGNALIVTVIVLELIKVPSCIRESIIDLMTQWARTTNTGGLACLRINTHLHCMDKQIHSVQLLLPGSLRVNLLTLFQLLIHSPCIHAYMLFDRQITAVVGTIVCVFK